MFYLTGYKTKDSGRTRCLNLKDYKQIVVPLLSLYLSTYLKHIHPDFEGAEILSPV
jgi:hypothetical protein